MACGCRNQTWLHFRLTFPNGSPSLRPAASPKIPNVPASVPAAIVEPDVGDRGSERHKGTEPIEGAVLAGMRSRERATGKPASRLIDQRIPDPSRLFNSSLEGNTRRAIDIHEGEQVDADAFKALVQAAVARNGAPAKKR